MPYWKAGGDSLRYQVELSEIEMAALRHESGEHLRVLLNGLFLGPDRLIIEKTPENALFIEDLTALFSDAYFLHIVRDGRDVVASYVKQELF